MLERPAHGVDAGVDRALLAQLAEDPGAAWPAFLERYAGFVLAELRRCGLDAEAARDGFVYVCEKLVANRFHRLRSVQHLGRDGDLRPWLRTVVRNLAINWVQARDGRRRLLKAVAGLAPRAQRIFQLTFWRGLKPSEVREELLREGHQVTLLSVFDTLDELFALLSESRLWQLVSALARDREPLSLDAPGDAGAPPREPPATAPDPEQQLLAKEAEAHLQQLLAVLEARDRLILELRYEEALSLPEVAELLGLTTQEVDRRLRATRAHLRQRMAATVVDGAQPVRGRRLMET